MKRLINLKTKEEFNTKYPDGVPSNDVVHIEEDDSVVIATNNVDGEYKEYKGSSNIDWTQNIEFTSGEEVKFLNTCPVVGALVAYNSLTLKFTYFNGDLSVWDPTEYISTNSWNKDLDTFKGALMYGDIYAICVGSGIWVMKQNISSLEKEVILLAKSSWIESEEDQAIYNQMISDISNTFYSNELRPISGYTVANKVKASEWYNTDFIKQFRSFEPYNAFTYCFEKGNEDKGIYTYLPSLSDLMILKGNVGSIRSYGQTTIYQGSSSDYKNQKYSRLYVATCYRTKKAYTCSFTSGTNVILLTDDDSSIYTVATATPDNITYVNTLIHWGK